MKSFAQFLIAGSVIVCIVLLALLLRRQQAELSALKAENAQLALREKSLIEDQAMKTQSKSSASKRHSARAKDSAITGTLAGPSSADQAVGSDTQGVETQTASQPANPNDSNKETASPLSRQAEITPGPLNKLVLAGSSAKPTPEGITATLQFNPTTQEPMEELAIVIRLPRTSSARILSLEPTEPDNFVVVDKQITPRGNFAIYRGNIKSPKALSFNLALSGPETADVRGSCGIKPFLLEINSSGTTLKDFPPR